MSLVEFQIPHMYTVIIVEIWVLSSLLVALSIQRVFGIKRLKQGVFTTSIILTLTILDSPIEYLKGVGPQKADSLKKELSIFTFGDLLNHFPLNLIEFIDQKSTRILYLILYL